MQNIRDYGAVGDGLTDDRVAIQAAIQAALAAGGETILVPPGRYRISRYLLVEGASGLRILGDGDAWLVYPSDDPTVPTDAKATLPAYARSALFVLSSASVAVEGVGFEGGQSADLNQNLGAGVYARGSRDCHLVRCRQRWGASLFKQDTLPADTGARLSRCTSDGARQNVTVGNDAVIDGCHFSLPDTTEYDRVSSTQGSSHAIYLFAGRSNVLVSNCTFQNLRTYGIKVSGSSAPIRYVRIQGCIFRDCGGAVVFGADDNQEHTALLLTGNQLHDCGTNRQGWNQGHAVQVAGARAVTIAENQFHYTRDCRFALSTACGIHVLRYNATSQPVEQVRIEGNQFTANLGAGYATAPYNVLTYAIRVEEVGVGALPPGTLSIAGNQVHGAASIGIHAARSVGLEIRENGFSGTSTAIMCQGNRLPVIIGNRLLPGAHTSMNAQIRLDFDSFPVVSGNRADAARTGTAAVAMTVSAGGSAAQDHPLLGATGKALPAEGRAEVVFAYGAGWTDGDTVGVAGATFTYRGTITDPTTQFNSYAALAALIDALPAVTAADYGAPWGIATGHLRVRAAQPGTVPNAFTVETQTARPTAGVALRNGTGTGAFRSVARGEGPQGATVLWSPLAVTTAVPSLLAENAPAAALLSAGVWSRPRLPEDSGAVLVLEHAAPTGGEQLRFAL